LEEFQPYGHRQEGIPASEAEGDKREEEERCCIGSTFPELEEVRQSKSLDRQVIFPQIERFPSLEIAWFLLAGQSLGD
jgi:hypothetical protein